jgi:ABC-type glycerol-3-phosphate transport system permease component
MKSSYWHSYRNRTYKALRYIILTILAIAVMFPLFWMFTSSVKPMAEIISIPVKWFPSKVQWENFVNAWNFDTFDIYFRNSVIFTVAATLGCVLLASMAGYGFTKFRWRGKELSFLFVLSTMMLPIEVTMVPLFLVVKWLGMVNTLQGLIIPLMVTPFAVFYMRQFVESIPDDYIDSARVDGASELQIYLRVILPLAAPAIAGLGLMQALANWDQLLWPLIVNSKSELQVMTVGVAKMQGNLFSPIDLRIAISTIMCIPMIILLLVGQRRLIEMSALSGLK